LDAYKVRVKPVVEALRGRCRELQEERDKKIDKDVQHGQDRFGRRIRVCKGLIEYVSASQLGQRERILSDDSGLALVAFSQGIPGLEARFMTQIEIDLRGSWKKFGNVIGIELGEIKMALGRPQRNKACQQLQWRLLLLYEACKCIYKDKDLQVQLTGVIYCPRREAGDAASSKKRANGVAIRWVTEVV